MLKPELSTRVISALAQVLAEKGADPEQLAAITGRSMDVLKSCSGWVPNEEFMVAMNQAAKMTGEREIARETGKRITSQKNGPVDRALKTRPDIIEFLLHLPRFIRLVDRNHGVRVIKGDGNSIKVRVNPPADGLHSRDHCLLMQGMIEGILERAVGEGYKVLETRCQVPIDQAGEVGGKLYRFGPDRGLLAEGPDGREENLGRAGLREVVEVDGTSFGESFCEYTVSWPERRLGKKSGVLRRLIGGMAGLFSSRGLAHEEYRALLSWERGPVKWEYSQGLTRLKYLSCLLVILVSVLTLAKSVMLYSAGYVNAPWAGLAFSALVLAAGLMVVRSGARLARKLEGRVRSAEIMLDNSGVSVVSLDRERTVTWANSHAIATYGNLIGSKCYEAMKWEVEPCPDCKVSELWQCGGAVSTECRYLDRHGNECWSYVTMSPLTDEDGEVVAVSHAAVNIQDKKKLELELSEKTRALAESEAKYKNYMRNAADAILITDLDFHVIEYNRQMGKLAGVSDEDSLLGASIFDSGAVPSKEKERLRGIVARMLDDRHPRQFEMDLVRRDGGVVQVEVRAIPVFVGDEPYGVQSIFRDITARKRDEFEKNLLISISRSIKEAPDLDSLGHGALSGICTIMNVPVAGLYVYDQNTRALKVLAAKQLSDQAVKHLAIAAADWSAKGIASRMNLLKRSIFVPDVSDLELNSAVKKKLGLLGMKAMIMEPLMVKDRLEGGIMLMSADQKEFSEERQTTIKQVANELAMGIARQGLLDVIQKKNAELTEKNIELENTYMQLLQSEKLASIGQLAAGVAHEINNPMGYISSNLNVLEEYREDLARLFSSYRAVIEAASSSGDSEVGEALEEAQKISDELEPDELFREISEIIIECKEGANRVKNIIRDLRNFSHPESGKPQWFDLHQGIESTLNIVWNELKYKAEVRKEFGDLPQIKGYPQEINQVFMNLLVNAAQAVLERGQVSIRTWTEGDFAVARIEDNGVGIEPEHLGRIFDPFFTTKEVGKGTGLGLSISYQIVQKHGGDIRVESEPGKGTAFTIYLPIEGPQEIKEAS